MYDTTRFIAAACAVFALSSACVVDDADLEASAAVTSIDVSASTDQLADRVTRVTGSISLGYTSSQMVQIRILDNDAVVYADSVPADSRSIPIDVTVQLLHAGRNELTVAVEYNAQKIDHKMLVTMPVALASLTLAPDASAVNIFEVGVSGTVTAGHHSDLPAVLELRVDGAVVHSEELDLSTALTADYAATIPLDQEGSNEIVADVTYEGEHLSQRQTVAVSWATPSLAFPNTWNDSYTRLVGKTVSGDVTVTPADGYTIDRVSYSVDGGARLDAVPATGDDYTVTLDNPDIGAVALTVRVDSSADGHRQTTDFYTTLTVAPEFDCANPGQSMLPDNDLIQNVGTNNRTMVGYFGHPGEGHTVSFAISVDVPGDGRITVISNMITYGDTTALVGISASRLRCQNEPCTLPDYDLSAVVDGVEICNNNAFGSIIRY